MKNNNQKYILAWFCVFAITNPAGIANQYLAKNVLGGIFFIDIFFVFAFLLLFLFGYNRKYFFYNQTGRNIFNILLIFSLYKIFIWGFVNPDYNFGDFFREVLVRERDSIYGFIFIIPVYLFALRDLKIFTKFSIIFGTILLGLSLISVLFNVDIITVNVLERSLGTGILRYYLNGYGLLNLLIPLSIVVFIGKIQIPNKRMLYVGGVLAFLLVVITLTKGQYLKLVGIVGVALLFTIKLLKIKVSKSVRKFVIFFGLSILVLNIAFPKYGGYAKSGIDEIISITKSGETLDGKMSRNWMIPAFMFEIKRHPVFGTGHGYSQLSDQFVSSQFDATDFSFFAHIMQYGLLGICIYLLYFFVLGKHVYSNFKIIRKFSREDLINDYKYEIIIFIASVSYFAGYFASVHNVFLELTKGISRIEMSIYTGLILASMERMRLKQLKAN